MKQVHVSIHSLHFKSEGTAEDVTRALGIAFGLVGDLVSLAMTPGQEADLPATQGLPLTIEAKRARVRVPKR